MQAGPKRCYLHTNQYGVKHRKSEIISTAVRTSDIAGLILNAVELPGAYFDVPFQAF
jgi:hypothetical protein